MSYPILYSATETNFDHNGIGILSACVSCEVTEEANGIFELAMTYPMDGIHYEYIADRAIIKAKADQFRDAQLFRVYAISKPMNGIVTVLAEHISYDLSGIPVKPFSASTVSSALTGLKNNSVVDCPFDFWTDKSTQAQFNVSVPASIRSRLGGVAGSILDVYGGEYEFDNFTVKLHNSRGQNRGVSIRYGKNLTDIQQDQNCSNVSTGVYPYWVDSAGTVLVELPEKIVNAPGTYNFVKIRTLDLSREFETQPTIEQLRSKTERYINANNIGVPVVSWSISFEQLSKSEEYKHLALLERVSLFDTVNVEFPALGVSATAKAVKIVYDVIADRVKTVTLGSVRANIADTIANQQTELEKTKDKPSISMVQKISSALAKAIMGANGGAVRLIDTNDDGEPDELYIADNPDPNQAVKVWRFNYNGWAASKNGYSGPFEFGATLENGLLANFVTAAQLVAGTIKSQDNGKTFFLDLDNGILNMNATTLTISGNSIESIAKDSINIGGTNLYSEANTINVYNNEFLMYGNIAPIFDERGLVEYTISFDIKSLDTSNNNMVNVYCQNGSGARYSIGNNNIEVTTEWQRKSITVTPAVQDLSEVASNLAFFGGYGTGNVPVVANLKIELGNVATDWSPSPQDQEDYVKNAIDSQTQTDIFNKLTNNGTLPGLFMENGQLYINASYLAAGVISSADGRVKIDLNSDGPDPEFSCGISVASLTVRSDILDDFSVFHAGTLQGSDGGTNYLTPWLILDKPDNTKAFEVRSYIDTSANTYYGCVKTDSINPGKKVLFYGFCGQGDTCTVPNTALYDLFAVRLGDAYETSDTVALCYKVGNVIRGVGGWAGTEELSKELHFFSATFSGDTWTIEDCGRHDVYSYGDISEGTRLYLKQVIGII